MVEFVKNKMSSYRAFNGLSCEDGNDHKYKRLTGLCWRVLRSTLDAAVGMIRIIPQLVNFLVAFWIVLIKSFCKIMRNTNSDYMVIRLVKAIVFIVQIVTFHTIMGCFIRLFYGPLFDSVVFVLRNVMSVYKIVQTYEDFE